MSKRGPDWTPFQPTRFEYLNRPVIWLPPLMATLEGDTPVYLSGSRGTGKTTLLKALSYDMRLANHSLRSQLAEGKDAFRDKYIGLYLRLPDYVTMTFGRQPIDSDKLDTPPRLALAFSLLLEFQCLQLLFSALAKLRDAGEFRLAFEDEQQIVADVRNIWPQAEGMKSFRDLGALFLSLHMEIQTRSFATSADFDVTGLPTAQFGSTLQIITEAVLRSERFISSAGEGWRAKVCFDEAECLRPWQQLVVNSIVRLTKAPVSFVIAYVSRDFDTVNTYIHDLQLTNADRLLLSPFDDISRPEYRQMTTEVANLYIRNLPSDVVVPDATLDIEELLGPTSINSLLFRLAERNKSAKSVALLEKAKALQEHPLFRDWSKGNEDEDVDETVAAPPIYQAYLIERLRIRLPEPSSPAWLRRQQDSAELRKRMVAAYLAICDENHWTPLFAGHHVVYNLSTNCIRDFLDELRYLYMETGVGDDVRRFMTLKALSPDKQSAALLRASDNKRAAIPSEVPHYGTQVRNLLATLGDLCHELQMNWRRPETLRSPERGKFTIIAGQSSEAFTLCQRYVQHAIDGGAIRLLNYEPDRVSFGLHRLLAPAFGFSYRRPQYEVRLNAPQLLQCIEAVDSRALERAINDLVMATEVSSGAQQELPFEVES